MLLNLCTKRNGRKNKYASDRAKPSLPKNSCPRPHAQPGTQVTGTWVADNSQYQSAIHYKPGIVTQRQAFVRAV